MQRTADAVYVSLEDDLAIISFEGGITPYEVKKYVKEQQWTQWEKRISDKGKEKMFIVADLSDMTDKDEWGLTRLKRINILFLENGMVLFYRKGKQASYDSDYEKYVDEWEQEHGEDD